MPPKEIAVVTVRMMLMISIVFIIQVFLFKYTKTAIKVPSEMRHKTDMK
jgi:cbb3-type cytochrome oxidase cytochrome c subunit